MPALAVVGAVAVLPGSVGGGTVHEPEGWSALPAAARGAVSTALGRDDARFAVRPAGTGLVARNGGHGLRIRFDRTGVGLSLRGEPLHVRLAGIGRGEALTTLARDVAPVATANRVEYRRGEVTEWYTNGPLGLEQGFTVDRRPAGGGPLTLALALSGALARDASATGTEARFGPLAYRGLVVNDATGRLLPARLALASGRLSIRVDDADAAYPVRIDPFFQLAKLTASDGVDGDALGYSIAVDGDTVVAGAPGATVGGLANKGAAYVFVKPAGGWSDATETAKLTASDGGVGDNFGQSVAVDGDTVAVGSPDARAVYVFAEPADGWVDATEAAKLTASDGAPGDRLGWSVAIDGDTVAAGAYDADIGGQSNQGAVYVFVEPGGGWADTTQSAKLTVSDGASGDLLGWSVAVDGDTVAAGAGVNADPGSVYVFVRPGAAWADATETAKLTASDGAAGDGLGYVVSLDGDTLAAGALQAGSGRGAVYVFVRPGAVWGDTTQTAKLTASDAAAHDQLGYSVGLDGDTIVAGADLATVGGRAAQGAAYVFVRPSGGWTDATETAKLSASDGVADDALGESVGVSGDLVVASAVGNWDDSSTGEENQGQVYAFADESAPDPPTGVTATAGDRQATVSWTAPGDEHGAVTGYTATASPGGATCTAAATSCTVTGLTNGTSYTFTVHSSNDVGDSAESSPSAAVAPRTVPGAPTGVSASAGDGRATVSWSAPASDGSAAISGYTATASPGGAACSTSGSTSCTVTGLDNGTGYTFTVTAANSAGTGAASSPSASVTPAGSGGGGGGSAPPATLLPALVPPAAVDTFAPTAPRISARLLRGRLVLSWTGSTDDVGVVRYRVERDGALVRTAPATADSVTLGLRSGVYLVRAVDAAGNESAGALRLVATRVVRPSGLPRAIPRWAWHLLLWQLDRDRGPRPKAAPHKLPRWYGPWRHWRLNQLRLQLTT
jgi:hypothetical protein